MDEDDSVNPPDGSSGGGREIVNRTSNRRDLLQTLWARTDAWIDLVGRPQQQQQGVGANPVLDAQIRAAYDQLTRITQELDYGSGWDAYDPAAFDHDANAPFGAPDNTGTLPPQPPPPPPPPPPAADADFME